MTEGSRLAAYQARVAAKAAEAPTQTPVDPENPIEPVEDELEDEENPVTDQTVLNPPAPAAAAPAAVAVAPAAAAPAAAVAVDHNARMKAVFAHADVKGKEALAADLLADADYDGLSAEGIIKILGKTTTVAAVDDESAQGREMLDQMKARGNVEIGSGGKGDALPDTRAKIDDIWDKARARNGGK